MAAKAIFGWENLVRSGIATLVPFGGDETADHDADRLFDPHPSSYWRTVSVSPLLSVVFDRAREMDLIAAICSTGTPHSNLLKNTRTVYASADWTETGGSVLDGHLPVAGLDPAPMDTVFVETFQEDGGSSEHKIVQSSIPRPIVTSGSPSGQGYQSVISAYVVPGSSGRHVRLSIQNSAPTESYADFTLSGGGAINSTSAGAGWSISASISLVGTTNGGTESVYRCSIVFTPPSTPTAASFTFSLLWLDSSYNSTYTGTGQIPRFGGLMFESGVSGETRDWAPTDDAAGSYWRVYANAAGYDSGIIPIAGRPNLSDWADATGWIHAYYRLASTTYQSAVAIWFDDADNPDGYLDLSNLYIGPSFQPSRNFASDYRILPNVSEPLISRAAGGQQFRGAISPARRWRLRFGYQNPADTWEFHAMRQAVGSNVPIVAILDPEEATYGQEQMIYGWLEDLRIEGKGLFATSDGMKALHEVELDVLEAIP